MKIKQLQSTIGGHFALLENGTRVLAITPTRGDIIYQNGAGILCIPRYAVDTIRMSWGSVPRLEIVYDGYDGQRDVLVVGEAVDRDCAFQWIADVRAAEYWSLDSFPGSNDLPGFKRQKLSSTTLGGAELAALSRLGIATFGELMDTNEAAMQRAGLMTIRSVPVFRGALVTYLKWSERYRRPRAAEARPAPEERRYAMFRSPRPDPWAQRAY